MKNVNQNKKISMFLRNQNYQAYDAYKNVSSSQKSK